MDDVRSRVRLVLNSEVGQRHCKAASVGQTFLSASWGDFPVAPRPDWKVRRTGRLESLPHMVWRESQVLNFGIQLIGLSFAAWREPLSRRTCPCRRFLPIGCFPVVSWVNSPSLSGCLE